MTMIHKIELLVIDDEGLGAAGVCDIIQSQHYPNHCISPKVIGVQTREVDWSDDHPINKVGTQRRALEELFASPKE